MKDLEIGNGTSLLRMIPEEDTLILKYNPGKMLRPCNNDTDSSRYEENLKHIKRRIDWCIRKSDGQNPNIDDYPPL